MYRLMIYLLTPLAVFLINASVFASVYSLPNSADGIDLHGYINYAYSTEETPENFMATHPIFTSLSEQTFVTSATKIWYSLELKSSRNNNKTWFIQSLLPNAPLLRAYVLGSTGKWQLIFNDTAPFSKRPIQAPLMVIPIEVTDSPHIRLLIEYKGIHNMPPSFLLYDETNLQAHSTRHIMFNSMLIGFCILLGLLSAVYLVISPSGRTLSITILSFLIAFFTSDISGFNFQYLWPEYPGANQYITIILGVFLLICFLIYTIQIFNLKKNHPKLNHVLIVLIALILMSLLPSLYFESLEISIFLVVISGPLIIYTSVWAIKMKLWAAKIFLLGALCNVTFSFVLTGLAISGILRFNYFPVTDLTKIGFICELFILATALIYRAKLLQFDLLAANKVTIANEKKLLLAAAEKRNLIAEKKLANEKRKYLKLKADISHKLLESKNQVFSDLSHELRTPISVLKLQVESLQHELDDNIQSSYQAIQNKLFDMEKLISDVGLLAQSDTGEMNLELCETPISERLEYWSDEFERLITSNDLHWQYENLVPINILINADASRLKQVLSNVLMNSVKYTTKPGTVSFSSAIMGKELYIVIEDSSPSVPEDQYINIFERLYRIESSRSRVTGGSGLGLAICKSLLEGHKGEISAENSALQGLKIIIKLPIVSVKK